MINVFFQELLTKKNLLTSLQILRLAIPCALTLSLVSSSARFVGAFWNVSGIDSHKLNPPKECALLRTAFSLA